MRPPSRSDLGHTLLGSGIRAAEVGSDSLVVVQAVAGSSPVAHPPYLQGIRVCTTTCVLSAGSNRGPFPSVFDRWCGVAGQGAPRRAGPWGAPPGDMAKRHRAGMRTRRPLPRRRVGFFLPLGQTIVRVLARLRYRGAAVPRALRQNRQPLGRRVEHDRHHWRGGGDGAPGISAGRRGSRSRGAPRCRSRRPRSSVMSSSVSSSSRLSRFHFSVARFGNVWPA